MPKLSPTGAGSRCARPTSSTSAGRSRAASRDGPTVILDATASSWPTRPWPPARTPATRSVAARGRVRRLGRRDRVQPGSDALPGRRDARGPARPVRRRGRRREGVGRAGRGGRGDRPLGLVRGLGRQDRPGVRRRQPGRRAVLQHLQPGADRRGGVVAPRTRRCSAWSAWSRRRSSPATPWWSSPPQRPRCRRSPWPRCWPPPTCPAAWSTCSPATPPRPRRGWPRTCDVNALDLTGVDDPELAIELERAAADNLKRVRRPELDGLTATPAWTG